MALILEPVQRLHRLTLISILVASAIIFAQSANALPEEIAVNLFEPHKSLQEVFLLGPCRITFPFQRVLGAGQYLVRATSAGISLTEATKQRNGSKKVAITERELVVGNLDGRGVALKIAAVTRRYQGTIRFKIDRRREDNRQTKLKVINLVSARDYVNAVVGSESNPGTASEALKAQAVLTQTRLMRYRLGNDLGDSTNGEAYLGSGYVRAGVAESVNAVWGDTLQYEGRPITVFYHAACAGKTSRGADIFGKAADKMKYLTNVDCSYCKASPFWKVTRTEIEGKDFARKFGDSLPAIERRDVADRPLSVLLRRGTKTTSMSGYEFWIALGQEFGWDKAPGTRYEITGGLDGRVTISSGGAGHGVGLCQSGAAAMARSGMNYREILRFYFPGTTIEHVK